VQASDVLTLYEYNYWANARILESAARVSEAQYFAPADASFGSLHKTLVHILGAEWMWRMRCQQGVSPPGLLSEKDVPAFGTLRARWQEEERAMRTFLAGLRDEDMIRLVRYTNTRGKSYESTLWHILAHIVNHGTQFRSEAGMLLTAYGQSPGDVDLIFFLRERLNG
jgi:uncharacterized damage-inducible protein DinB